MATFVAWFTDAAELTDSQVAVHANFLWDVLHTARYTGEQMRLDMSLRLNQLCVEYEVRKGKRSGEGL